MKKIIYLITGIIIGTGILSVSAAIKIRTDENVQRPTEFISISDTSTTTRNIPRRFTHFLDSEYLGQGVCLKIRDSDGAGYTYLQTLNGLPIFSQISCE